MLHSALPRAYLTSPGMGYLGSYFGAEDARHPYSYVQQQQQQHQQQQLDESYARLLAWDTSSALGELNRRPPSPCPLDLSLKPPPTPSTPSARTDDCEAIEVDDEEDRRSREEARSRHSSESRYPFGARDPEEDVVVDDVDSQRSCSSAHSYQPLTAYEHRPVLVQREAERLRAVQELGLTGYTEAQQKLLLASPSHLQTYQQQLQLLTPPHPPHPQQQQQQYQQHLQGVHAPMTPPSTPSPPQCPRRKNREEDASSPATPRQPGTDGKPRVKKKHARKLKFDEDTSSPVSGTVILGPDEAVVTGDIDPAFNIVEVTEEARAELAKIENRLGPYQCKLCRQLHDDAFQLAQHRCSRIAHVEYRCPECDKRFSCPANLASHRRWHKPRPSAQTSAGDGSATSGNNSTGEFACSRCDAKFNRQAALRKHATTHHPGEPNNNNSNSSNNNNQGEGTTSLEICKQEQQQQQQHVGSTAVAIEMA